MKLGELFEWHTCDLPLEEAESSDDQVIYEAELICEIAYNMNVDIHEMSVFFQKANEQQKKQLQELIKKKDVDGVWDLIFRVTGMRIMR